MHHPALLAISASIVSLVLSATVSAAPQERPPASASSAAPSETSKVAQSTAAPATQSATKEGVTAAPSARDEGKDAQGGVQGYRVFVGITGGILRASAEHPSIKKSSFTAPTLGLHVGYRVSSSISLGFEITSFEKYMRRSNEFARFEPEDSLEAQADCSNCTEAAPAGGKTMALTAVFLTAGPRLEYTPFGEDGLYLGAFAGMASVVGLPGSTGVGGALRAGFRLRPAPVISLALEGGVQAQSFEVGNVFAPYAQLVLRPYF
ncbi:hypothetical protein [Chondromyces apiculatus]|nr:hypothetical protein [Chondromyces apiculatus]